MPAVKILNAATATGAGGTATLSTKDTTFQASGTTSTGSGAATVVIEVSDNGDDWLTLGTITLTLGTTSTSDGFAAAASWAFVRANVTAISGTDATVSAWMGV